MYNYIQFVITACFYNTRAYACDAQNEINLLDSIWLSVLWIARKKNNNHKTILC